MNTDLTDEQEKVWAALQHRSIYEHFCESVAAKKITPGFVTVMIKAAESVMQAKRLDQYSYAEDIRSDMILAMCKHWFAQHPRVTNDVELWAALRYLCSSAAYSTISRAAQNRRRAMFTL